jgi:hypothetical protein
VTYHQVRALFALLVIAVTMGGGAIAEFKRGDQTIAIRLAAASIFASGVFVFALIYWLKHPPTKRRKKPISN